MATPSNPIMVSSFWINPHCKYLLSIAGGLRQKHRRSRHEPDIGSNYGARGSIAISQSSVAEVQSAGIRHYGGERRNSGVRAPKFEAKGVPRGDLRCPSTKCQWRHSRQLLRRCHGPHQVGRRPRTGLLCLMYRVNVHICEPD